MKAPGPPENAAIPQRREPETTVRDGVGERTVPLSHDAIGFADIDATEPQWCYFCTTRPVDPDYAPFCSAFCQIDSEVV